MDTLIVQKDISSLQFHDILEMMSTRKRQKSILVMESEVEDFKVSATSFVYSLLLNYLISLFLFNNI